MQVTEQKCAQMEAELREKSLEQVWNFLYYFIIKKSVV
jgi:hypothetical protein